ncbi:MAG: hypothetical protein KBH01_00690 [Breznakibacter sp.]|nr:hypothetical protein [Breznakibacter sp.]
MKKYLLLVSFIATFAVYRSFADGKEQYRPFAPDGVPFVVADSAFMPDMKGNHRAVVKVSDPTVNSVVVTIPWRRPDLRPETKKVVIYGVRSGKEITNVSILEFSSEKGKIAFQPLAGETEYYVYYLPYKFRRGWDDARYGEPWNDYLAPKYNADADWRESVDKNKVNLPSAKVERIESRSEFDAFTPMGLIATQAETEKIVKKYNDNFLVYTEDREFPIRLPYTIPVRWTNKVPALSFSGTASRNEYYTWQIGIWATKTGLKNVNLSFSDFVCGNSIISKDSATCFNQGGINWDGKSVQFTVDVPKGHVQALWCGIQIPAKAKVGTYTGTATLTADGEPARKIKVTIKVDNNFLADKGDGDLWRHSRLRWLNSTIGMDGLPVKPFVDMQLNGRTIQASGKNVIVGENGLPEVISINNRQVLAKPISFEVVTTSGSLFFKADNLALKQVSLGMVSWTASSVQNGMEISATANMDYDGMLTYNLQLAATDKDIAILDVRLNSLYAAESSGYFMGAGFAGGFRPDSYNWDWQGPYDSFWIGGDKSGLHVEFTGDVYHGPLIADYKPGSPQNWSNGGKGRISLAGIKGEGAAMTTNTGAFMLTKEGVQYGLNLLITPVMPVNPAKHFSERYYHADPKDFSKAAEEGGANIENIHHARQLNPYINYPFLVRDSLVKHIEEQHKANRKVKLYYTVRELTTYCTEIYALKSLQNQILEPGVGYGLPWEYEHLIDNYKAAWYTELPGQVSDAALVLVGNSRWINYYLEGLRWMLQNYKIDGIYMDDVSFDRPVMKRMRRIMEQYRPEALIDLHSNTGYSKGPANQYAGFFPYVDRLWFGESFKYDKMTPDQWFVTASGIPFGQMAEMLQDGGNRYLGMVYGETARDAYGEFSPRPVWALWRTFGIEEAKMIGYWEEASPVASNHPNVKVTAYVKDGKTLLAIGNFDENDQDVRLEFDWKALGLSSDNVSLKAPYVENFQDACDFSVTDAIPVKKKQGWLLIVQEATK